jgi:hypothetical protein
MAAPMNIQSTQEFRRFSSYAELAGRINIPSMQRSRMDSHVRDMEQHIIERTSRGLDPIFGSIDLAVHNGQYYVIDGQHRLAALERQFSNHHRVLPILCIMYNIRSKEDMIEVFSVRNKGIPVPDFITNPQDDKTDLLKKIQEYVEKISGFDYRQKKRPYINIPDFMDGLRGSKLFSLIDDELDFRDIFNAINDANYEKSTNPNMRKSYVISEHMIKLCTEWCTWIGIDKNMPWFEDSYNIESLKQILLSKRALRGAPPRITPPKIHRTISHLNVQESLIPTVVRGQPSPPPALSTLRGHHSPPPAPKITLPRRTS